MTRQTTPVPTSTTRRRTVLAAALGTSLGTSLAAGSAAAPARAATTTRPAAPAARASGTTTSPEVAAVEARHDRRVGVYARNLRTGRTLAHRPDETFAMCSTFKTLAVGAVLAGRLVVPDPRVLQRRAYWPPSLVEGAGYAPRLGAWQAEGYAPTIAEVGEVTMADSDNAGANLLMQLTGGPASVTALARDLGDAVTTLTRWEPALNEWEPGQTVDVTSPRAMGTSHAALLVGRGLRRRERDLLRGWMLGNRTGDGTLRAGLPDGWSLASKTGSGAWGTRNDVGVAWAPDGTPLLVSCLTHGPDADATSLDAPLREVAEVVVAALA